jgi:hypothetical protein
LLLEILGKGYHIGHIIPEICFQIPDLNGVGTKTGEKACSGWIADSLLAVGSRKGDSLACKSIHMRRKHKFISIGPELGTQIIHRDEQDIWLWFFFDRIRIPYGTGGNEEYRKS